jgi:hypothetical protein
LGSVVATTRWTSSSIYAWCSPISIDGLLLLSPRRLPVRMSIFSLLSVLASFMLLALDVVTIISYHNTSLDSYIYVVDFFLVVKVNLCITKLLLFPTICWITFTCIPWTRPSDRQPGSQTSHADKLWTPQATDMWGRIVWWLGHGTDPCSGSCGLRTSDWVRFVRWGDAARRRRGCHGGSAWTCQSAEAQLVVVGPRALESFDTN